MTQEEYTKIFSYPHSEEDREYMHRSFAGVVCVGDFGAPIRKRTKTIVEMQEMWKHNHRFKKRVRDKTMF